MGILRRYRSLLNLGLVLLFSSCNLGIAHMEFKSLNNARWDKDDVIDFTIIPKDTTLAYNWFIQLRTTQDYPYSNLYVITELSSANQQIQIDTIAYTTANPDGSWRGISAGSLVEHKIPYRSNFPFSSTATYSLKIRQAMRALEAVAPLNILNGVSDVGYSIETIAQ